MKGILIGLLYSLCSLGHGYFYEVPAIYSNSQLVSKMLLVPLSAGEAKAHSCNLGNEDLKTWIKSAHFLLDKMDYPTGQSNTCSFYDWLEKQHGENYVFNVSETGVLKVVESVDIKNYLWDLKNKKIVTKENKNTTVYRLMEGIGNQFLGVSRNLATWEPATQVNPFYFWASSMNSYFEDVLEQSSPDISFLKLESSKPNVFSFKKSEKEKIENLHLFKTEYWVRGQGGERSILGSAYTWRDTSKKSQKMCFKVASEAQNQSLWGAMSKKYFTYEKDQTVFDLFSRISNCPKEQELVWQMAKWINQGLIGFGSEQLLGIMNVWEKNQKIFQSDQQSKEFLLQQLNQFI